jgi:hypothetical protein
MDMMTDMDFYKQVKPKSTTKMLKTKTPPAGVMKLLLVPLDSVP